jgi:adipocyte-derived leucine aminopeptidase
MRWFDLSLTPPVSLPPRLMEQSLAGEVMKTQDLPHVVISVSRNPKGYKLAWDFLRHNWHTLVKK